jgi:AGZA family xanthine/uracil permease-like MFS transporter
VSEESDPIGPEDAPGSGRIRWITSGDINGFFGLMVDNLTVMALMAGFLINIFKFPAEIIYTKMLPGTAFGVLFGDLVYTWIAWRIAKRTGNPNVTAMPLGLDTPSSLGIVFTVLGPAFGAYKAGGMSDLDAANMTWYLGMATMVNIGVIKLIFSFAGKWLQRVVPQAGLLGSLSGIGLALIGLLPMLEIFKLPIVGLISLGLIFYSLVAGIRLPKGLPGVAIAVLVGTVLHYCMPVVGLPGGHIEELKFEFHGGLPMLRFDFLKAYADSLKYLPIAFPFAILTVIGGVNVTESARVGGDEFDTQQILLTEAVATLLAGLCGGVAQSTPYIGQPAYKAMGARLGYTAMTGLFVGLGGILGYVGFFVKLIPAGVLAPILVFVALDIVVQAFLATKKEHAPAVALAHVPTLARLLAIKYQGFITSPAAWEAQLKPTPEGLSETQVIVALGNGFILTGMLWGAFLAELIDRRLLRSAGYLMALGGLAIPGIIHSASQDGNMYNPMSLSADAVLVPKLFGLGYFALAGLFILLSFTPESKEPPDPNAGHGGHFG